MITSHTSLLSLKGGCVKEFDNHRKEGKEESPVGSVEHFMVIGLWLNVPLCAASKLCKLNMLYESV